jgi:hypothetical protein
LPRLESESGLVFGSGSGCRLLAGKVEGVLVRESRTRNEELSIAWVSIGVCRSQIDGIVKEYSDMPQLARYSNRGKQISQYPCPLNTSLNVRSYSNSQGIQNTCRRAI